MFNFFYHIKNKIVSSDIQNINKQIIMASISLIQLYITEYRYVLLPTISSITYNIVSAVKAG